MLVIDDDPVIQVLLTTVFEDEGYAVLTAGDGLTGLAMAHAVAADAIVLDLKLPRLGGMAVLEALKDDERTAQLPVVVFSAKTGALDIDLALAAGAARYYTKPCDPGEITSAVGSLLLGGRCPLPLPTS